MKRSYDFDIAFSFVAQDESLATDLYNLLKDRLRSFIYHNEQDRLAGTDGEARFNEVFGELSRVVVILYRQSWGNTPWTRVEETAIRNRAHDEGYDFALLIPVEPKVEVPKWFPKNRLWIGLDRWGLEGAASAIEARVVEQDGEVRILTTEDKIRAKLETANHEQERKRLLNAHAQQWSHEEYVKLLNGIQAAIDVIIAGDASWRIRQSTKEDGGAGKALRAVSYNRQLTVQGSYNENWLIVLHISIWKGVWAESGQFQAETPTRILDQKYIFDLDKHHERGWQLQGRSVGFKYTEEIIEQTLLRFMDLAEESRNERSSLG